MPIKPIELMELMEDTIGSAAVRFDKAADRFTIADSRESYFRNLPKCTQSSGIESLEMLLNGNRDMISTLVERYEKAGNIAVATAVRALGEYLTERANELNEPEAIHRRLSGLVYPVV